MMTKDQYANYIVDSFCESNGIIREDVTNWGHYMRASSTLAVCLEHLGLLSRDDMRYSKTRGGFGMFHPITHLVISSREILRMLPDDENQVNFINMVNPTAEKIVDLITTHDLNEFTIQVNRLNTNMYFEIDYVNKIMNIVVNDPND